MTQKHEDNLLALANILLALPEDYSQFHMSHFFTRDFDSSCSPGPMKEFPCGTVGCALGHAVLIPGVNFKGSSWWVVADTLFGIKHGYYTWEYLFSPAWAEFNNTPQAAGRRILKLLGGFNPEHDPWNFNYEGV